MQPDAGNFLHCPNRCIAFQWNMSTLHDQHYPCEEPWSYKYKLMFRMSIRGGFGSLGGVWGLRWVQGLGRCQATSFEGSTVKEKLSRVISLVHVPGDKS